VLINCSLDEVLGNRSSWLRDNIADHSTELGQFDAKMCSRPHDNRHVAIEIAAIGTAVIIFLAVTLRVTSRFCTVGSLWWDDWWHAAAGVCICLDPRLLTFRFLIIHEIGTFRAVGDCNKSL
jgi:hypothetical protein